MTNKLPPLLTPSTYVNIHELNERIRKALKQEGLEYSGRDTVKLILNLK